MKSKRILAWALAFGSTCTVALAQNPFVGTWKLNPEKSHLTGEIVQFTPAPDGALQLTADGSTYSFEINGKNYRMASGDLAAWSVIDASTWKTQYLKSTGKELYSDTWKLSADGKTLTVVSSGVQPAGNKFTDTATYTRTSGTTGLPGSWKCTSFKMSTPEELVIGAYGIGGLSIKIPAWKATLLAAFDGKDVVPSGPNVSPGLTLALFRIGPASFRLVRKINGKVTYSSRFTVSADSKTMTETGNSVGNPSQTAIWEKQ
jgi:hypothetical protein